MSRATALLTGILVTGSIAIAAGGIHVGHRALEQTAVFSARCESLAAENAVLKEQLSAALAAPSATTELIVTLAGTEYAPKTLARANRNLLNVRQLGNGEKFVGQIGVDKDGHCIFAHPAYSVRAAAMVLKNYEKRHGIKTVERIVTRFAEGNRAQYIAFLCKRLGLKPKQEFSVVDNLHRLLPAMIRFETGEEIGQEYTSIIDAVRG